MLSWHWPWLILLAPLPWLLRYYLPAYSSTPEVIKVPFFAALLSAKTESSRTSALSLRYILCVLIWTSLIIAIMRPVWFGEPVSISKSGRDLMLAVDISDSMKIDDMLADNGYTTRMQALKQVVSDFIQRRPSDRIGLIVFGQRSYVVSPLTLDHLSVSTQMQEALPGFAGSSTAIGDAMGLAITSLRDRPAQSRVLILVTDGSNTSGSEPNEALQVAIEAGIRIHTVGVGASSKKIIDFAGRNRTIDPSRDLDESILMQIAEATGGQYFRVRDPAEMASIYATIDKLEPQPEDSFTRPQYSLYHWPLAFALLLASLIMVIGTSDQRSYA